MRDYLGTLKPVERKDFAEACGTSLAYLQQIAGGHSRAGAKLSRLISEKSQGEITLGELRPDIWTPDEAA